MTRFTFDFCPTEGEYYIVDTHSSHAIHTTKSQGRALYLTALFNAHPEAVERREAASKSLYDMSWQMRDHSEGAYEAEGELHAWIEDQFAEATAAWRSVHGECPGYYDYYGWHLAPAGYHFHPGERLRAERFALGLQSA